MNEMYFQKKGKLVYCKWDIFREFDNLIAVFSTRKGGFSTPPYNSLNLGSSTDDLPENVINNRNNFFHTLNISEERIASAVQVHGDNVIIAEKSGNLGVGDGLITDICNIFLCGTYADCASVMVFEPYRKVIGLFHVGWKSLSIEIVKKGIRKICRVYSIEPDNLLIGISPHIKQCCYVVRKDVAGLFEQKFLVKSGEEQWKLNIENIIVKQLNEAGVEEENIERSNLCTSCNDDMFFSYRRDKRCTGRMLAVIGVEK
ncbi:MAG: peptidoglycan editing factor PgeF [Candidatus Helarchaeota archaeon]|nr:peptidoglycan editing factor PgeF [Candidatus Helarchaeota archaeon]